MASLRKGITFLSLLSLFCISSYDVLTNYEENGCVMTWMYEQPMYLKVPQSKNVKRQFPRYSLYLYGEGFYAHQIKDFSLSGIPVLFIPGNAGSYRQVRSLASVALRKAPSYKNNVHFNYFAVDLNEELSGLFGGILQEQTEYVAECVEHILTLYKNSKDPPASVVMVGHSMGGIIARALFTLLDFDHTLIHTIITQATPHQAPVISLDYLSASFYQNVNDYWQIHKNGKLRDVTVFSSGGGYRDVLVRSGLTVLQGIVAPNRSVSSLTMSIPRVWVSTDHQCIVWCNQFVRTTKRAMFDIIDPNTKQISTDADLRVKVFQHHLHHNPGSLVIATTDKLAIPLANSAKCEVKNATKWTFSRDKIKKERCLLVPILGKGLSFGAVTNATGVSWLTGCKTQECVDGQDLSEIAYLIPPEHLQRKVLLIKPNVLEKFSYLIIRLAPSKHKVEIIGEMFSVSDRSLGYEVPGFWQLTKSFPFSMMTAQTVIESTLPGAVFYKITINNLHSIWQAVRTELKIFRCVTDTKPIDVAAISMMALNVPWTEGSIYSYSSSNTSLSLKLMVGKPTDHDGNSDLHLVLNPACTYTLVMRTVPQEMLGQIGRFCLGFMPVFIVINILMALAQQLKEEDTFESFSKSHGAYAAPWRIVPLAALVGVIIRQGKIHETLVSLGIPEDDFAILTNKRIAFGPMNFLLYMIAYVLVRIHVAVVENVFKVIGTVCRCLCTCRSKKLEAVCNLLQYCMLTLSVYVACFHCGAAAILIIFILCGFKVIRLFTSQCPSRHLYISVLFILLWVLILNSSSFIVWLKNISYSVTLKRDPSFYCAVMCCVLYGVMCITDRRATRYGSVLAQYAVHGLCIVTLLYSEESVYRLPFFMCIALAITCLLQLRAIRNAIGTS